MKKIIASISLFIFIIFPAYVFASGTATDKTCYNLDEKLTYLREGTVYWFDPVNKIDYMTGEYTVIVGQEMSVPLINNNIYYNAINKIIIADTACSVCTGTYDDCIASCENDVIDYSTNDVEMNYTNACAGTAIGTMDTIMGSVLNTTISLITKVLSDYWPLILMFSILAGLTAIFFKLGRIINK